MNRSRRILPLVLLLLAALAIALAPPASSEVVREAITAGRGPAWGACEGGSGPVGMECAPLSVPLDWADPQGRHIVIMLGRLRHDRPGRPTGSVLVNFGAGAPGVAFLRDVFPSSFAALRHRMDIVTWDPRGYPNGLSTRLPCTVTSAPDPALPTDQAGFTRVAAATGVTAGRCRALDPALFDSIGSATHARDMDAIRRALGESRVNLYMGSYGGAFGQAYARLFPRRVRTMVIDGGGNMSGVDRDAEYTALAMDSQRRFQRFAAWCGAERLCALHGRAVTEVWRDMVARADRSPLPAPGGADRFDGITLQDRLASYLIGAAPDRWGRLAQAIADADRDDASGFAALPRATSPSPDFIACPDFPRFADYATFAATVDRLRRVAPDTGIGGTTVGRLGCLGYPTPVTYPTGPLPRNLPPLLGAGTWSDFPATDRAIAQVPGSRSLYHDGPGHELYATGNACVIAHVDRYLTDRVLPPPGTQCP